MHEKSCLGFWHPVKKSVEHFVTYEGFYETTEATSMNDFQDSFWYSDIQLIHKSWKTRA